MRRLFLPFNTKTYLYNCDPLQPQFTIVKLGFTGYTLFLLFLLKNIDRRYSLEPPHLCLEHKFEKKKRSNFFL